MKTIILPISGHKVEIRTSLTYSEFKELDNFYVNRSRVEMVDGVQKQLFEGNMMQELTKATIQKYLHNCRTSAGGELSTIGLMDTLDVEDGQFLENEIMATHAELKKKLTKTPTE